MRRPEVRLAGAVVASLLAGQASAASQKPDFVTSDFATSDLGTPIGPADLRGEVSIPPSGAGLPPGHGTAGQGAIVYADRCASCHGDELEGIKATGAPALVGGRGTLAGKKPIKTVESYWPYATTLFDYVKRAMPFNAPGSLSDEQVYGVVAYILARDKVIASDQVIDATTLPTIRMPNRGGFVPDPRPGAPTVLAKP